VLDGPFFVGGDQISDRSNDFSTTMEKHESKL